MDPEPEDVAWRPYAAEPSPDPVLLCRRPPCRGAVYRDQETHDFLRHGGHPPAPWQDPLDVTTHADYADDPVRRAAGTYDVIHHRAEEEAFASARAVAITLVVLMALVFVVTIALVSGRPPQ